MNYFKVGRLLDPRDDDKRFTAEDTDMPFSEAVNYAREWASKDRRSAIAIWDGDTVFCVFLDGLTLFPQKQ